MTNRRTFLKQSALFLPIFLGGSHVLHCSLRSEYKNLAELLRDHPVDEIEKLFMSRTQEMAHIKKLGLLSHLNSQEALLEFTALPSDEDILSWSDSVDRSSYVYSIANQKILNTGLNDKALLNLQDLSAQNIKVVWNRAGSWRGTPRARLFALQWAKDNLQCGGFYIDEKLKNIPSDADYNGFQVILKNQDLTVFRKV